MKFAFVGIFLVIEAIIALGHYFVYATIMRLTGIPLSAQMSLRVGFGIMAFSFVIVSSFAMKYYGPWLRPFYQVAAFWLGTMHWLIIAAVLCWLLYAVTRLIGLQLNFSPIASAVLALGLVVSIYGLWNSYQTQVRSINVRLEGLPEQWRGRRAVFLADTHIGNMRSSAFAEKITKLINEQQPDVVLITGDLYDGTVDDYRSVSAPFGKIQSRFGTYFATGNHEEFRDSEPLIAPLRSAGINVLTNRAEDVDGLQIAGINYRDGRSAEAQAKILADMKLDRQRASILIKHVPDKLETARDAGIDLQVSGHTHSGQMWPFNLITQKIFGSFFYGLNSLDSLQVYTTSGVGTWGPPQRVGTNPEIVVATFE